MYLFCINHVLRSKCGTRSEEQGKLDLITRQNEGFFPWFMESIDELGTSTSEPRGCSFFVDRLRRVSGMSISILAPAHITSMLTWSIICVSSGETSSVSVSSPSTADRCRWRVIVLKMAPHFIYAHKTMSALFIVACMTVSHRLRR